jgi:hypothetical protein
MHSANPSMKIYRKIKRSQSGERHSCLSIGCRSPFVIPLDISWLSQNRNQRLQVEV